MKPELRTLAAALGTALALCTASFATAWEETPTEDNMSDPHVKRLSELVGNHTPPDPAPDSFGMDKASGIFIHPAMTRDSHDPHPFEGRLDYWDTEQYIKNMTIEAYYPITVEPFHTWQNMVDFDGRRYLYQYVRRDLKIFDVTDPKNVKLLLTKGNTWGAEGADEEVNPYPEDDYFGAATIQWNEKLGVNVMVQSFEIRRFGLLKNKYTQPDKVQAIRDSKHLKGFKVYAMHGPLPKDWKLLAERSSDYQHPDAPIGEQQGSGARDIPTWFGGDTLYIAAAPDASHALTEYPNDLYSAGYQAWDMSDPANPKFLSQLTMPGQIAGDADSEAIYKNNPRAGNRTSWMGARMSLFTPDDDSQYAYAAMGGLGFYVVDVSDPNAMKVVSHLEFEPNVAGVEGDFVDVSQVKDTGLVYTSGYPLNEDCWEPYKDVFIVDVNDPKNPTVVGTLPRPAPPAEAKFTDYCQRRGSFGPKRTGAYTQPGVGRKDVLPFNFYNAGLQVYDVSNPQKAEISAYFVPPFNTERVVDYARGNLSHAVFVEYDRNLFWLFTNHGFYVLSSPVLGKPNLGAPKTVWPAR
jgi:LVIVD repeat